MSTFPIAEGIEAVTVRSEYSAGDRAGEIYHVTCRERIVFLGTQVDQTSANLICAQLLLLEAEDRERDISLYINSPGGSVTDGLAIYDTMQYVRCDVSTICLGLAASWVSSCSVPAHRASGTPCRTAGSSCTSRRARCRDKLRNIAIQAEQIIYLKRMMAERIALHTGQTIERIEADSDRDRWFTAQEALDYGFIDRVIDRSTLKTTT